MVNWYNNLQTNDQKKTFLRKNFVWIIHEHCSQRNRFLNRRIKQFFKKNKIYFAIIVTKKWLIQNEFFEFIENVGKTLTTKWITNLVLQIKNQQSCWTKQKIQFSFLNIATIHIKSNWLQTIRWCL